MKTLILLFSILFTSGIALRAEVAPYAAAAVVTDPAFEDLYGAGSSEAARALFDEVADLVRAETGVHLALNEIRVLTNAPWSESLDVNGAINAPILLEDFRLYRTGDPSLSTNAFSILLSGRPFQGGTRNLAYVSGAGKSTGAAVIALPERFLNGRAYIGRTINVLFGYGSDGSVSALNLHPAPPPCSPADEPVSGYISASVAAVNAPPTMYSPCARDAVRAYADYAVTNPAYMGFGFTNLTDIVVEDDNAFEARIAVVCDSAFYQIYGIDTQNRATTLFETAREYFERSEGMMLSPVLSDVFIMISGDPWPVSANAGEVDAPALLSAFAGHVNTSAVYNGYASVMLLSGYAFSNSITSFAFLSTAGRPLNNAGVIEAAGFSDAFTASLIARSIGQNFGYSRDGFPTTWQGHPDPPACDPAGEPLTFIHAASLNPANPPTRFSPCSAEALSRYAAHAAVNTGAFEGVTGIFTAPAQSRLIHDNGLIYTVTDANFTRVYEWQYAEDAAGTYTTVHTVTNDVPNGVILYHSPAPDPARGTYRVLKRLP